MARNTPLYRGATLTLKIIAKKFDEATNTFITCGWDEVENFYFTAYSEKSGNVLKKATKANLTIPDPAASLAYLTITAQETAKAELNVHLIEYKYGNSTFEDPHRAVWGYFIPLKSENVHFV